MSDRITSDFFITCGCWDIGFLAVGLSLRVWDRDINVCYKVVEGMNSSSTCKAKYFVFWVWCTMAEITPLPSVFLSSLSWNRTLLPLLLNKIAADKNCLRDFSKTLPFFLQIHDVRFTSNKSPTKQTSGKADQTCITQKKVLRRTGGLGVNAR